MHTRVRRRSFLLVFVRPAKLLHVAVPAATADEVEVRGERGGFLFGADVVLGAVLLEARLVGHAFILRLVPVLGVTADRVRGMLDWYAESFANDPAGWIAVWVAVAAIVLSAVFWRTTWTVLKAIGRAIRWVWRKIARIRITTVDRVTPLAGQMMVPARWEVGFAKDGGKDDFLLVNHGTGSIARDVQLDVLGNDARLRSAAVWPSIDGNSVGAFKLGYNEMAFYRGVIFEIRYTDAQGQRRYDSFELGG